MAEYIEREAAYPLAKKICDAIDSEDFQRLNLGMRILDWIDDIPAADVVPVRHGRWTGHDIGNGRLSIDDDTCSLCGSRFYQIAETGCVWHYCPNCGADMREES